MTQKQRENFYRISTVIVEHGKEVLAFMLEDDLLKRNLTLIDFINLNKHEIYHLCYNKNPCCQCRGGKLQWKTTPQKVLYPSQLDILFDKTGRKMTGHNFNVRPFCCSSAKQSLTCASLDLTLLRCLLINFVPSCIGSVRQDVEDLIKHRNNLHGHSEDGKMSSADYSMYKIQIEQVILSIAKHCNKEKIIRQKLQDATIRAIDDTICTQFQNILLEDIRREMDKNETIVDMQVVMQMNTKKLDNIERSANEINRRGRDILVQLLFSSDLEESMAESSGDNASGITKEAINLVRLFLLMVKATEALRVKFDEEFSPHSLQTELHNVKMKILEPLKKKRIINHTQWSLLFPGKGSAKSSTFDLSLMTCLLRHLASLEIGDMLPVNTDTRLCADISRLKYYRNIVYHSDNGTLSDNLFLEYWTDISQAIIRLGGSKFKQICCNLKVRKLNDDDIKELTCLCDTIPKGKKKIYDKIVGKWKQENVIETRIIKQISKLVETEPVILAIGPSGCGKSTAIRRVAVDLQRQKEFRILPAKSAEDIVNYYNPDIQQVFVIDDLCGKATIDTNKVTKWYDYSNEINEIINENKVRILASCRIHIFQDRLLQPIGLLRKAALCDFLSDDFCLTDTERNKIASSYLTKEETDQLSKISNISRYNFFPLLCNLYSRNRKGDIIEFFENPTQAIRDELDSLFKADNQKTYGTLMLFIVYNNYLSKNLLDKTSGIKPILETINDTLHLNSNFSIEVVKSELENLQNFYVKNDTNAYSLIHDKIFDILVCFQGEHDFDILIDIAHTDVIRDRFLLTSLSENDSNKVLIIPVEKEETYLCRLFKDITEGFLEKVFLNKNLACTSFRERLIEKINTLSNFNELLYNASSEKIYFLVLFMLHNGYYDTVPLLITEHVDLNKIYNIGETPLFVAVNEGYSEIVNLFLNNNVNPNIPSWYTYRPIQETPRGAHNSIANVGNTFQKKHFLSKKHKLSRTSSTRVIDISLEKRSTKIKKYKITPLYIATSHASVDIVEMLLKHHADPNIENMYENETPLYIATVNGNIEIVTLLLQFRACPNFYDKVNRTPLYIAAEKGHDDIVKVLLEYNAEPNTRINRCLSGDMKIPLHIASKNGHVNIVTLLLQYKADPCIKDRSGKTALYLASAEHHTDIVKLLLKVGASTEIICCIDNNSPISIASEKGYADIVKLLLNNKADPNIRDECYKTSLYLSSARHHTDVVKLLLENGAHTETICSVDNNSPISVASQNGYGDIVTLLLKFNADPNIRDKYYRSALYLASAGHHPDVVKILLQYGAYRDIICSEDNNSPISIASEKGYGDIVKLLE